MFTRCSKMHVCMCVKVCINACMHACLYVCMRDHRCNYELFKDGGLGCDRGCMSVHRFTSVPARLCMREINKHSQMHA